MFAKNITTIAKDAKLLPLSKIVSTRSFKKIEYNSDNLGYLPLEKENITSTSTGTLIDFLTRAIVLNDDDAFAASFAGVKTYATDSQQKEFISTVAIFKTLIDNTNIDNLDDAIFSLGIDICSWEEALRSHAGIYIPPTKYPDVPTILHYKFMLKRAQAFLAKVGPVIRTGFGATTENGCISGDGDYLLSDTLIDFKVSKRTTMNPDWVRQLFLYRVLLHDDLVSSKQIQKLMVYNPRRDEGYLLDLSEISPDILNFVRNQAEEKSRELLGSVDIESTRKKISSVLSNAFSYKNVGLKKEDFLLDKLGKIPNENETLNLEQLHQILLFLVDYFYINKQFSLNDANEGAGFANNFDDEAGKKLIQYEHTFKAIPLDKELPDTFFITACKIVSYIIMKQQQKWVDLDPNDYDIKHLRIMFDRISKFLNQTGLPTDLKVKGSGFAGNDWKHFTDIKEEPYSIDLKNDSTALILELRNDEKLDITHIKSLKGALDDGFAEVGIFNPRLDTFYYKKSKRIEDNWD